MYKEITLEEFRLMSLYTPGYRNGLIDVLSLQRKRRNGRKKAALLDNCLAKLRSMTDEDYDDLQLYLDCPEDLADPEAGYDCIL